MRSYEKPSLTITNTTEKLRFTDTLILRSNLPVTNIDTDSIQAYSASDTFSLAYLSSPDPLSIRFLPEKRPQNFSVALYKGAVKTFFDQVNDSAVFSVQSLRKEDLGNLTFRVVTDSSVRYVLQLYNAGNKKVLEKSFSGESETDLQNYLPGKYTALLIKDTDSSGSWTTGNYFTQRQPEKLIRYSEPIEIRANWDLELEWIIQDPFKQDERDPGPAEN